MSHTPWWWDFDDALYSDFRNLVYMVWAHMGLPPPTPAQYDIAYFLQFGWAGYGQLEDGSYIEWFGSEAVEPDRTGVTRMGDPENKFREDVLEAFRGIGKSYLTSAFCLWRLLRDPVVTKIIVVSASGSKAKEFVAMTKMLLTTMPVFAHMVPRVDQRDKSDSFDVNGANISQSPSIKAVGITGQITGSRATLIVADDIEVVDNSRTEEARLRLLHKTNEFAAIKVTGGADVIFLGTPQTEESIYTKLIKEMGAVGWILPARFPMPDKRKGYVMVREGGVEIDCLCPMVRRVDLEPELAWKPTDPERFNESELHAREIKGRAYFALQFQLDTSLSDAERYPLKLHDLIVMSVNSFKAPAIVQWGHDSNNRNRRVDLNNFGFSGDHWLGPLFVDPEWRPFEQAIMFVDPSGRGKDETAWAVVKVLNGMLYVVECSGHAGDVAEGMAKIATAAKAHNVSMIQVEPNYAGNVWIHAFQPVLASIWPTSDPKDPQGTAGCTVEEAVWSRAQKEVRIIETLEPVMNLHKLVVDERVAQDPILMYQLTHITKERGSLTHDDRVDALAGAVAFLMAVLQVDVGQARKAMEEAEHDQQIAAWLRSHDNMVSGDTRVYSAGHWNASEDDDEDYEVYTYDTGHMH